MSERRLVVKSKEFSDVRSRATDLVASFLAGRPGKSGNAQQFWDYLREVHRFYVADNTSRPASGGGTVGEAGVQFARGALGRAVNKGICIRAKVLEEDRWTLSVD